MRALWINVTSLSDLLRRCGENTCTQSLFFEIKWFSVEGHVAPLAIFIVLMLCFVLKLAHSFDSSSARGG